jgi:hypothetical protein
MSTEENRYIIKKIKKITLGFESEGIKLKTSCIRDAVCKPSKIQRGKPKVSDKTIEAMELASYDSKPTVHLFKQ